MARRKRLDVTFGAKRVKPEEELESGLPRELRNRPKRRDRRLAVKPSLLDYIRTGSEVAQGLRPENIPMTGMRAGKQLGPAIGGGLSALYDYARSTAPGQVISDVLGAPVRFGEEIRENPAILAELIPGAGTVQGIREGAQRLAEGDPEAMRNAAALAALAGAMDVIPGGGKGANLAVRGAKELAEEGVDLGVKRAVSELTPSPQNTETLSRVGKVTFDQEKGVGQVPLNQNVNYRGFTAMMRPSKFLELASSLEKPNRSSVEHIKNSIEEGKGIGSPFLNLDFETGRVKGHEGRHRMLAIQEVQGDEPVPVHIFGRGEDRARHLASEDIESFRNKMTAEEGGTSSSNFSEAFHLGNVVPDLSVKPTESSLSVTKVPATPAEEGVDLAARESPLLAVHNINARKLGMVERLGGLPVPSIAVINPEHEFTGFGNISLIAPPEMVTPSRGTPVFASDVYSSRFPALSDDESKIFRGYTQMGNRRYAPLTLENVVREMRGNPRNVEGINYGAGSVRAMVTPQFRSMREMQAERGRIVSPSEFQAMKDEANDRLYALAEKYYPFSIYPGNSTLDFPAQLAEAVRVGFKDFDYNYKDLPPELLQEAREYLSYIKDMPTEYFEAKPQRGISLGEFQGAVVPMDVPEETLRLLEQSGIKDIEQYDPDRLRALPTRKEATQKFRKQQFKRGGFAVHSSPQLSAKRAA